MNWNKGADNTRRINQLTHTKEKARRLLGHINFIFSSAVGQEFNLKTLPLPQNYVLPKVALDVQLMNFLFEVKMFCFQDS